MQTFQGHGQSVTSVIISADDKYIISGSLDKLIKIWSLKTFKELRTLSDQDGEITSLAVSPDNQFIVSGSFNGTVKIWDFKLLTEIEILLYN